MDEFTIVDIIMYSIKATSQQEALDFVIGDEFDVSDRRVTNITNWTSMPEPEYTAMERAVPFSSEALRKTVYDYFNFRGYKFPTGSEALMFITSELGELADAHLQASSDEWVRNHPDQKHARPENEVADIFMMLMAYLYAIGVEKTPAELMLEKMRSKGFSWT